MKYFLYIKRLFKHFFCKVMPTKKNRILFTSFNGHYSDSPKYICEKIYNLDRKVEIVWLVKKQYFHLVPKAFTCVDVDSFMLNTWYRATSRIFVDNVYGERESYLRTTSASSKLKFKIFTWLKNKKNQILITTWHGTPLKRMGRDRISDNILDFSCPNAVMILGNQYTIDIMQHITFSKIKMKLIGTPRNDLLFEATDISYIKKKLGLPINKKVILFAPTFRDSGREMSDKNIYRSGINQLKEIDFALLFKTLSEKFGNDWVLVCRFHYHVEELVDWDRLQKEYPDQIINGNKYDDMAEYLACTDVLLTDASSCMFDFALTKKPCFLLFPDLDNYQNIERGFYTPINELPFSVAIDFEKLIENIKNFNQEEYNLKIDKMLTDYGYVDDADSSERIAKYILEKMNL